MQIEPIIQQLRQYAPVFTTVGGAAEFTAGLESVVNPEALPAAYVVPLAEDAGENESQVGLYQLVTERVAIILELLNTDRRGQAAATSIDDLKFGVFAAILNWRLDPIRTQKGLNYVGSRLLSMDRGRLFWQLEFDQISTITDADGFIVPAIDLTKIDVDMYFDQPQPTPEPPGQVEVDITVHPT